MKFQSHHVKKIKNESDSDVKSELSFAESANQLGVIAQITIWALVLYLKVLSRDDIHDCRKDFFFSSKIFCKSPLYVSHQGMQSYFPSSGWLTSIVSQSIVSALLCRRKSTSRLACVDS